jgi:hypothetical protein
MGLTSLAPRVGCGPVGARRVGVGGKSCPPRSLPSRRAQTPPQSSTSSLHAGSQLVIARLLLLAGVLASRRGDDALPWAGEVFVVALGIAIEVFQEAFFHRVHPAGKRLRESLHPPFEARTRLE